MNKSTLKFTVVSCILIVLIALEAIFAFINSKNELDDKKKVSTEEYDNLQLNVEGNVEDNQQTDEKQKSHDYETAYLDYIDDNVEYFSRGMLLCDLNDDGIPELFSIAYDENGDLVRYHEFKDGVVTEPSENSVKTYIDINNLIQPTNFYENTTNFFGLYKNKSTGQKALINSIGDGSENDVFDIIIHEDDRVCLNDEGVKSIEGYSWSVSEKRDYIMINYEVVEGELYAEYRLRGEFGSENGADASLTLKALIDEFEQGRKDVKYDKASDGEFFCYIKNIDLENDEITLIPVASITYEEYEDARNSEGLVTVNGEEMSIQTDENSYQEFGEVQLFQMPWFEYWFNPPTAESPISIIRGYRGNTPVKVKMSKNLKIRYGVDGEYDADGNPIGYETLEREKEYSMEEYISHYAEYNMHSYYKAVIENDEIIYLDVFYSE